MGRRTVSTIRYVLGMTVMLVALAAFLALFTWAQLGVSGAEFLAIVEAELAAYLAPLGTTTYLAIGALVVLLVIMWRLFGFGSMEP